MQTLEYDPLQPSTLADPYPALTRLREHTPVFWHEGMRSWCLTRYADCVQVLRDHSTFARDRRRAGHDVPEAALSVQSLDPPDQAPLRSLFMNALRAQDMGLLERRTFDFSLRLLAELGARSAFDVMRHIAAPVAVFSISDLLGVDPPDIETFAEVSDAIMRSMDAGLDPSTVQAGLRARSELTQLVASWMDSDGLRGLLGAVMRYSAAWLGEGRLYVRNTARVMFQGGYSTTMAAIGNVVQVLLDRPEVLRRFRNTMVPDAALDELIRFDGPVQGTSRIAVTACVVGGQAIQAGDTLVTLFAAANRDPDQFPNPDALVLDRSPNPHLGYGWGTHSCVGTIAAQATLRGLVSAFAHQPASLRATGPSERRRTATMRVFASIPATLEGPST